MSAPVLVVRDLTVTVDTPTGDARAVDGVSMAVHAGETVCLVGESGSGKTMTALALMRLLPPNAAVGPQSDVRIADRDIRALSDSELRAMRGRTMSMVFQEPMPALNPVRRVGDQVADVARVHLGLSHADARARAIRMLHALGVDRADERAKQYPHELSGGLRQRVLLAMALLLDPVLLIADEPTTALDVTIEAQLLDLLRAQQARTGLALLLITHDLGVVAEMATRVLVMYGGQIVEDAPVATLFSAAAHPYTQALLAAALHPMRAVDRLHTITGTVPSATHWPSGCRFRDRCPLAMERCASEAPALKTLAEDHAVRCHLTDQAS